MTSYIYFFSSCLFKGVEKPLYVLLRQMILQNVSFGYRLESGKGGIRRQWPNSSISRTSNTARGVDTFKERPQRRLFRF